MPRGSPPSPRILVLAGSIRSGAFNGKTADVAQKVLASSGADVTRNSLADYPLPLMDEDLEATDGVPEQARQLSRLLETHDSVLIASPDLRAVLMHCGVEVIYLRAVRRNARSRVPTAPSSAASCATITIDNRSTAWSRRWSSTRAIAFAAESRNERSTGSTDRQP